MRKKVLTVFGTRPEAVKMAPVIRALRRFPEEFECVVCCTGQHGQLVRQAMQSLEITADVTLNSMSPGQSLGQLTGRLFSEFDACLEAFQPDWVLVQGDTTSAMAAATCAFYRQMALGHVEAGLRTGDRFSPFPEEVNRVMIGRIADLHFAPTERALRNLLNEGVARHRIHVTGNTVVDALNWMLPRIEAGAEGAVKGLVQRLGPTSRLILVTCHRRESFGEGVERICRSMLSIVERHQDVSVVFVTHLNPDVRVPVHRLLNSQPRIALIDPVDYFSLLFLITQSHFILTDSGGIQEEAPSFGKPVLVMREVTERPEAIEAGCARLVGTDMTKIVAAAGELLGEEGSYQKMVATTNPFGDGMAGERIVSLLRGDHPRA